MSAARDVEVEDTATETDLVLGPETPSRGFSAWRLATIGTLAVVGALCVTWTISQGIPGLAPAVQRQPVALASSQYPQTGCAEGVDTIGTLYAGDNSQCVAACQNQDGCEQVVFTTVGPPSAAPTAPPTALPTAAPTSSPTATPTTAPTASPTAAPTAAPTASPTATPTTAPTASPTAAPTSAPTSPPQSCVDTNGAATNTHDHTCQTYTDQPLFCHPYDDDTDFTALDMCCACEGGSTGTCVDTNGAATNKWDNTCQVYTDQPAFCLPIDDDTDFTALDMCCACKGASEDTLPPPPPPPPPPPVPNCVLGRGACTPKSAPDSILTFLHKVPPLPAQVSPTITMSPTHTATNLAASQTTAVSCGKGCSNWGDILLDKGSLELEECKTRCDALSGCAAYNYQLDDCEGAPGAKTCYLFSSGCQVAESACWTLFEKLG